MSSRPPAAAPAYAELQATTNFSFLRGGSHAEELVATAKALGLAALAVTDRNTLAGVVRAHAAAKEVGLKLIVGARLDFTESSVTDAEETLVARVPSLLCLPKDRRAYGRLSRLLTLGQRRAEKGRCRLFLDDLTAHAEGQIFIAVPPDDWDWREANSGASAPEESHRPAAGIASLTPRLLAANENAGSSRAGESPATFESWLARVKALTSGQAELHVALTHSYRGTDRQRMDALSRIAGRLGLPCVATGDVLYHAPHRRALQDVVTCIREKCTLASAGFRLAANAERHLKPPLEMMRLFRGYDDAVANTCAIAARCTFTLDELVYEYPDEPVPAGQTPQAHLEHLTWEGARERYRDGLPAKIEQALRKELDLIAQLAYAPYFLTVHDIVRFARSRDILCQGRGSAANSAVCYCLGITNVNPIEIDLLFERFITPERKEPPDIDVDFEHERREEVIQYIYQRYGRDRAGLAATVISYRARSAVREVGKVMGLSEDTIAALAGMVWGTRAGDALPDRHVREAGLDPADPLLARVLELTDELIGFPRHLSQHVGGFVLTRSPLSEVVPIGNAAMEDRTCIEWDKDDLDTLGLLKVDVLGLGMLSCIHRAFDFLAKHHERPLSLATVPREDDATYDMLCAADSIGIFQVESRAQMNMLPRLKPRTFYDLVIEVAIVRPGPIQGDMVHPYLRRRDGLEPEDYPSPDPAHGPPDELRQILGKTRGVPLFQEQAMRIAMVAARFTADEVNQLRKAMATFRRRGTIGLLEEKMIEAMAARGYDRGFAERCFNQIKGFGEYGFPESHAASFAHLVYVSAWLKCHYPEVFAAALLNSQPMGFYAPAQIVRDAREHGVEVRPVDVNHSNWDCTLEPGASGGWAMRLGFRQIDGLREDEAAKIVAARRASIDMSAGRRNVHFRTAADVWARAGLQHATLERLAGADAFRSVGLDRRQALWEVKALAKAEPLPLFSWAGDAQADDDAAAEIFDEAPVLLPAMPLSEHVVNDYQTLRLSLKAHPMTFLRTRFRQACVLACSELAGLKDGVCVSVAGVVLVRQRPGSAKGVVFMTIEDETGIANAVIWPKTLERYRKVVMGARLILIRGRIQRHENIIHVVSARLEDASNLLSLLADGAEEMKVPIANADEVLRPEPGSARGAAAEASSVARRHPRDVRIIPKSRDFH